MPKAKLWSAIIFHKTHFVWKLKQKSKKSERKKREQKKWAKKTRAKKQRHFVCHFHVNIVYIFNKRKVQRLWNSKLMNWNLRCTSSARVQRITPLIWFQFPFASNLPLRQIVFVVIVILYVLVIAEMKLFSQRTCNAGKKFFSPLLFVRFTSLSMSVSLVFLLSLSISVYLTLLLCIFLHLFLPQCLRLSHSKCKKKTVQANKEMSKSIEFGHTTFTPFYPNEFRLFANFHSEHIFLQFF